MTKSLNIFIPRLILAHHKVSTADVNRKVVIEKMIGYVQYIQLLTKYFSNKVQSAK